MIIFSIISCLFFNLSTVSTSVKERHCNFSRYMLNYFSFSQQYLLRLNESLDKISEEDFKKYGEAIQTHSDVILLMITELHCTESHYFPRDLMVVNLYLNNVSGSVNLISRNLSIKNTKENKKLLLLKGYQMIHEHISKELFEYIYTECIEEVMLLFVDYPKIMYEHSKLNIEQLVFVTKDLRNKIIKELNTNLCTDSSTQLFSPKNVIFFDLFTHQPIENEKNFMNGSQRRQIKSDIKNDYLDLLRFTPLNIQCADGSDITLSDVFRFIKFNFNHRHVESFQKLVRLSTFYPVYVLLSKYINFINNLMNSNLNANYYKYYIRQHIIKLAETLIEYLINIKDLNILNSTTTNSVKICINRLKTLSIKLYNWPIKNKILMVNILNSINNLLFNKCIKCEMESNITITHDNIYDNYKNIIKYSKQVKDYITNLEKYKDLFVSQLSLHKEMKHSTNLQQINYLTDEVVNLGFVKIETSLSSIQNEASIDSNETQLEIETTDSSKYSPCYMVDYLMYN
ncbi:uncharacterized protein LOC126907524 isoform X2 [Daktulosphaira vitifoliae]|uniref:uncharacterized protein LOC126907524 isoform X2 n=1 Tax=Daktulosphaira vitifoliae TaxID=58002 RepID=UPI0021AA73D6|nr:uncharacterized protein LOC126907524 isoform X2 [Daktulosphaira vitifoliae]